MRKGNIKPIHCVECGGQVQSMDRNWGAAIVCRGCFDKSTYTGSGRRVRDMTHADNRYINAISFNEFQGK